MGRKNPEYTMIFSSHTKGENRADLHVHTTASDGMMSPEEAVNKGVEAGLTSIAITDHDTVRGADAARNYVARRGLKIEVVFGEEVTTADGHLLGIYMDKDIPPRQPVEDTIRAIHQSGGLAIAAHPNLRFGNSLTSQTIIRTLGSENPEVYFDGVEIYNATAGMLRRFDLYNTVFQDSNDRARALYLAYADHPKIGAAIGNSDAHGRTVGNAVTVLGEGTLREAIQRRDTSVAVAKKSFYEDVVGTVGFGATAVRWNTRALASRLSRTK